MRRRARSRSKLGVLAANYSLTMNMNLAKVLTTGLVVVLLSACGTDGPRVVGNDDALHNVAESVAAKHADSGWLSRVDSVRGGVLADMKIETDLEASRPADMELALVICEAYANAIQTEDPYVLVYGNSTTSEIQMDGSVRNSTFEAAKLARATVASDGSIECIEAGLIR